jgi:hypothetical protein
MFLTLFACADLSPGDATDTPDAGDGAREAVVTSEALGGSARLAFDVLVHGDDGMVVEVVPVQWREDGGVTGGFALGHGVVDEGVASVTVPNHLPMRDRSAADAWGAVTYVIVLREVDEYGAPDAWVGVSRASLIWYGKSPVEGAAEGWNLWNAMEDGQYSEFDVMPVVDTNLVADDEASVSVASALTADASMHVALQTPRGADESLQVWDQPMTGSFDIDVSVAPQDGLWQWDHGVMAGDYPGVAYRDHDGSNSQGDAEPAEGVLCYGQKSVMFSWRGEVHDLGGAVTLLDSGARTGWEVVAVGDEGVETVPDGSDVELKSACTDG